MKKHYNEIFDETYYTDTLENGLEVIVFHKPEFVTSVASLMVKYGAYDYQQIVDGELVKVPTGIAHFLEHKMFESSKGDIMTIFSEMQANVNAYTSYNQTVYYFSTTNNKMTELVQLLLDFVLKLEITEESVEKEKGIICEELLMYQQLPESRIYFGLLKNMYSTLPINEDVGGSVEDVKLTTVDDLYNVHKINYDPSNMSLIITTNDDPQQLIDNLVFTNNTKRITKSTASYNEPNEVESQYEQIKLGLHQNKIALGIKLGIKINSIKELIEYQLAIKIYLQAIFTPVNDNYQEWLDNRIINDYFDFEANITDKYSFLAFFAEKTTVEKFKEFIYHNLDVSLLSHEDFEQVKNSFITSSIMSFNSPNSITIGFTNKLISGYNPFDQYNVLQSLNYQRVIEIVSSLDLSNYSMVEIV